MPGGAAVHVDGEVGAAGDDGTEGRAAGRRGLRQAVAWVTGTAFVVFALSPVITNYDSYSTFPTAVSLVNHHTLSLQAWASVPTLAHSYTVATARGHLVTAYPWATALFFVPTVVVLDVLHLLGGPSAASLITSNDMGVVQMETASVVTALACGALTWLAYLRFPGGPRRRRNLAVVCGLVFALGTTAWSIASRSMWEHAPSLLLLSLGLVALDRAMAGGRPGRAAVACGAAFAGAFAVRPTNAIPLAVVGVVVLVAHRRQVVRYVVGAVAVLVPWTVVTVLAYGTVLQPYFGGDNRSLQSAFLEALAANLVSPARGLLDLLAGGAGGRRRPPPHGTTPPARSGGVGGRGDGPAHLDTGVGLRLGVVGGEHLRPPVHDRDPSLPLRPVAPAGGLAAGDGRAVPFTTPAGRGPPGLPGGARGPRRGQRGVQRRGWRAPVDDVLERGPGERRPRPLAGLVVVGPPVPHRVPVPRHGVDPPERPVDLPPPGRLRWFRPRPDGRGDRPAQDVVMVPSACGWILRVSTARCSNLSSPVPWRRSTTKSPPPSDAATVPTHS